MRKCGPLQLRGLRSPEGKGGIVLTMVWPGVIPYRGNGMQLRSFLSDLFFTKDVSSHNRDFLKSDDFMAIVAENNARFGIVISLIVTLMGFAGLFGMQSQWAAMSIFQEVPEGFTYYLMILFNVPQIIVLALQLRRQGDLNSLLVIRACFTSFLLNSIISGISLYSTQFGSSLFFEMVLIMVCLVSFPYYRNWNGYLMVAFSAASVVIVVAGSDVNVAWQDQYDLYIFYALCCFMIWLRKNWFQRSAWLIYSTRKENQSLEEKSRTDGLTGLLNRMALREDFSGFFGHDISVIMMDLDNFKMYNDRYGHEYGDEVLRKTGKYISDTFGPLDGKCYRYGGDEFLVVVVRKVGPEFTYLLKAFAERYSEIMKDQEFHTMSVGFSYGYAGGGRTLRTALTVADECLYESKGEGKNEIHGKFFNEYVDDTKPLEQEERDDRDYDKLTGILNREGFLARIGKENLKDTDWMIISFDIDRFQEINKTYGYREGNTVLTKITELLDSRFPDSISSRLDADHFYVFTRQTQIDKRIRHVQSDIAGFKEHCYIYVRAGVWAHKAGKPVPELLTIMDMAKYAGDQLRRQSAQSYCMYDEAMDKQRARDAYIRNHFSEAIDKGYIEVYFQPILGAISRRTCGFEALARWKDPEKGMLSPGEFMPVLERSYDAYRLDFYMLRRVCERILSAGRERQENLFVSFNLSRTDFLITNVPEEVDRIVSQYGIPKKTLRVEITESAISGDDHVRADVQMLRDKGYEVWVDDFGAGSSSLNVLKDYDVDGAKMDMVFLRGFSTSPKSPLIIRDLIHLCHSIGVEVVVEGVETSEQLNFIRQCGGDYIQGFYYSKPIPPSELESLWFWNYYVRRVEEPSYHQVAAFDLNVPPMKMEKGIRNADLVKTVILEKDGNRLTPLRMNDEMKLFLRTIQDNVPGGSNDRLAFFRAGKLPCILKEVEEGKDWIEKPFRFHDCQYRLVCHLLSHIPESERSIIMVQIFFLRDEVVEEIKNRDKAEVLLSMQETRKDAGGPDGAEV